MKKTAVLSALALTGAGALAYLTGLGPLDPPAGPVAETSPSLADLSTQIADLQTAIGGTGAFDGPYEIWRSPSFGLAQDVADAELIFPGRVYVKSVSVLRGTSVLFDGPGRINTSTYAVETGQWVHRAEGIIAGNGGISTVQIDVEAIVENGLYIAHDHGYPYSYVVVRYLPLDPAPGAQTASDEGVTP